jgi:two-component system osmolarity sensor histidine kinase EnvZ
MLKRVFPRSLMSRALLIVVAPLIIMQVLAAYVFFESHWDQVSKKLARALAGEIALLIEAVGEVEEPAGRDWLLGRGAALLGLESSMEVGAILPNAPPQTSPLEGELRRALLYNDVTKPFRVDSQSTPDAVVVSIQLVDGVLRIDVPRARLFSWQAYVFVLWMAGTSLLLLGLAAIFMRNQVAPVKRLAQVADAFGKGREIAEFKPEGAREVRLAGRAFVAMRNRIQRQIAQRTAMLAGVSHDLRTPLTRMKLQLAMMRAGTAVDELKEDVGEMERMLEGYLAFARGEGTERPETCDLGALVADAVRQARRGGGAIELAVDDGLVLPLRPGAVARSVTNLIENALRCSRRVAVRALRRERAVEVVVDDDGPGVPPESREEVFKPFFRLEGSRNPDTGGVGLGLTIARDVARSHGGDLVLEDSPLGGLRARLRLPM